MRQGGLAFSLDCSSLFGLSWTLDNWHCLRYFKAIAYVVVSGESISIFLLKKSGKMLAPVLWKTIGQLTCRQQTILPTSLYYSRPSSRPLPHWKSLKATFQSFVPHYVMFIFCQAQKKWRPEILGQYDPYFLIEKAETIFGSQFPGLKLRWWIFIATLVALH